MLEIPVDQMSVEEKLHAMEVIWNDLCRRAKDVPSPAWHQDELAAREAAIERGEQTPVPWEDAKREIRRRIP